jgi:hypothetical protein
LNNSLEISLGRLDVECDGFLLDVGIAHDDHDISRRGKFINEGREFLITDDHRLELETGLDTTQLELLDDIANLLKSVHILMLFVVMMRNDQECVSFE